MSAKRSNHISTVKMPGMHSWVVKVNGEKAGVVRMHSDGMFYAVAGHEKLGKFDSKVQAVDAVAATVLS